MTTPVVAVPEDTLLFDLLRLMARKGVRRVPVVSPADQSVVGVVSVDDVILLLTTELANVAEILGASSRVLGKAAPSEGEEEEE